jgi:hypothetical protein
MAGSGSLVLTMHVLARDRITADRHPHKIKSFEDWQKLPRAA